MDIVKRLEQPQLDQSVAVLCHDAAKEIKRLRKELERIVDCEEGLDPQSYAEIVLKGR